MLDTKERILMTALRLFAEGGFEAVSVSDISGALGITKGALYKHYRNKREIFARIVERMEQRDAGLAAAHSLPVRPPEDAADAYRVAAIDGMVDFAKAMFRYWTQDEFAAQFRRMLTLEQFRSPEMASLYQQYLAAGPMQYMADLFAAANIPQAQAEAVRFYAPMFLLYSVYDAAEDKTAAISLAEAMLESAREHLRRSAAENRNHNS